MANNSVHVVFDLDDTLYAETAYVRSAFKFLGQLVSQAYGHIDVAAELLRLSASGDPNPIQTFWLIRCLPPMALADCVAAMRAHRPEIALREGANELLTALAERNISWSILTDGRSITQRQKIVALGLFETAGAIYISQERGVEKPALRAYQQIESEFPCVERFIYIADNPAKDFVAPNGLGWKTIMLRDNGDNTHRQRPELPDAMKAQATISALTQVLQLLEKA